MSRNPYIIDNQKPTLQQSVFVFIDILGYKNMILQPKGADEQQKMLRKLHQALYSGRLWLEGKTLKWGAEDVSDSNILNGLKKLSKKDRFALRAFTDNIVIGWPIRDDARTELCEACIYLIYFQFQMIKEGFFFRGAISVGEVYIDEIAVFGDALTDAHAGESTLARDPRIILTSSAVETVTKHLSGSSIEPPYTKYLLCDSDGQWFLNYLDCLMIAEEELGPSYEELLRHKQIVEEKLAEYEESPNLWSKYAWVAGYHNYFCDAHSKHFNREHKIDIAR